MTFDNAAQNNHQGAEKFDAQSFRDHGDGNNGMCLASLASDTKAFVQMASDTKSSAGFLPDFSIDGADNSGGTAAEPTDKSSKHDTHMLAHARHEGTSHKPEQGSMGARSHSPSTGVGEGVAGGADSGVANNNSSENSSNGFGDSTSAQPSDMTPPPPASTSDASSGQPGAGTTDANTGVSNVSGSANTDASTGLGTINGVAIGIDGHSDWTGTYANFTPQQTLDQVKSMGLGTYQTDLNPDDPTLTQQVIDAAQKDNIQVIGSIGPDNPQSYSSASQLYTDSFDDAAKMGAQFGSGIKLWQLGNEMDTWATSSPQNMQLAEAEISGLTAGLKSTDPTAQTMVNSTNGETGIQFLNQLQADGINWNVTGYHAYTQAGDVADAGQGGTTLADDAALGKPIYVNELNGWTSANGDQGPSALPGNAQLITNSLDSVLSVAKQDNIIGVNVYELLNTPEISGSEGQFGVLNADGSPTATSEAITQYMQNNAS
jgi:hypothetical protein